MQHARRKLLARTLIGVTALMAGSTHIAMAAPLTLGKSFDRAGFEAAQKAGKPIVLAVQADWCPTCHTQERIVKGLLAQPRYAGIEVYRIDFDSQKELLKEFQVKWQSTLIVFKGKQELSRTTAVTDAAAIEAQLRQAL